MFKPHFFSLLLIFSLALSGCAQTVTPSPNPDNATNEAILMETDQAPLTLTEEQNGGTVALMVNDLMRVQLDGNPTTGFTWETGNLDTSLLEQVGEAEFTQNSNLVGAGGTFTFTFKALKEGVTHLHLIYHRTFEKTTPPAQVFDVTVDIQ
jgi:inhibitor of cysteine peptidase